MRKIRWIAGLLLILVLLLLVTPGILGFIFEKKYQNFLSFVNSQGQVKVNLVKYHRGWFRSRALLQVEFLNPFLRKSLEQFDISQLEIGQTIQHGPIIYRMPPKFLMAIVHNNLHLPPAMQQKIANMGMSARELTQYEDSFTFTGRDIKSIQIQHLDLFLPAIKTSAQAEDVRGRVAIDSGDKNIRGKIMAKKLLLNDREDLLLFSDLYFSFDQTQNENDLWLGKMNLSLPFFSWRDKNDHVFSLANLEINGKSTEKDGFVNGYRNVEVKEIQFDASKLGPFHLNVSIEGINAKTLADMIHTYKKIILEGELYKSQLETKMMSMVPDLLHPSSKLKINNFDLTTPWGNFQLRGQMFLPADIELQNNSVPRIVRAVNVDLHFRVSKMLANDFVQFVTSMPVFYRAGPNEAPELAEARNDLQAKLKQNLVLISSLVEDKRLSLPLGLQLIRSQKNDTIKSGNYTDLLKTAFLKKQIDRNTSYILYLQYSQVLNQYKVFSSQVNQFQTALAQKFKDQINEWISSGYINEKNGDYIIAISREQGNLKINGKAVDL